jgi:hypothetical protein
MIYNTIQKIRENGIDDFFDNSNGTFDTKKRIIEKIISNLYETEDEENLTFLENEYSKFLKKYNIINKIQYN